jgi:putative transposase
MPRPTHPYISTGEGWLYLAGVKGQFTCEIVGYALGERMTQALVGQALWQAIGYQRPKPGLIHPSDLPVRDTQTGRGSQYCAQDYPRLLEQHGLIASMSRRGNCDDNVPVESFWGSLKSEWVHHHRDDTRAEAQASIRKYIEIFYHRQRRHSRLGYLAPAVFAQNFRQRQGAI